MVNEAEVFFKVHTDESGTQKKGARKRATQEAVRAEIGKDARALSGLTAVHAKLAERKWDKARLDKLAADADVRILVVGEVLVQPGARLPAVCRG